MANPGYPQQPPMGAGPQVGAAAPPPRPVRRGTSKAVPVVVSAGLAVGVFCGLLFGLGTGEEVEASNDKPATTAKKDDASEKKSEPDKKEAKKEEAKEEKKAEPAAKPDDKKEEAAAKPDEKKEDDKKPEEKKDEVAAKPDEKKDDDKKAEPAAAGSGSAAGGGAAAPAAKVAKLTVDITPADVVDKAKITIDGKAVTDKSYEVSLGAAAKKTVKVVVKASGYKDATQNVDVEGDTTVQVELVKRRTGPAPLPRPPTGGTNKKGGGLIDI